MAEFVSFPTEEGGQVGIQIRRVMRVEPSHRRLDSAHIWMDDGNVVTVARSLADVVKVLNADEHSQGDVHG